MLFHCKLRAWDCLYSALLPGLRVWRLVLCKGVYGVMFCLSSEAYVDLHCPSCILFFSFSFSIFLPCHLHFLQLFSAQAKCGVLHSLYQQLVAGRVLLPMAARAEAKHIDWSELVALVSNQVATVVADKQRSLDKVMLPWGSFKGAFFCQLSLFIGCCSQTMGQCCCFPQSEIISCLYIDDVGVYSVYVWVDVCACTCGSDMSAGETTASPAERDGAFELSSRRQHGTGRPLHLRRSAASVPIKQRKLSEKLYLFCEE